MIVNVFYNNFFKKIFLPSKVMGVYPIHLTENKLLGSIEGINGEWIIKTSDDVRILKNNQEVDKPVLKNDSIFVFSIDDSYLFLVATPAYYEDTNIVKANKQELLVGSNLNCDICYRNPYIGESEFKIIFNQEGYWKVVSEGNKVYLNNKPVNDARIYSGDYIFCFGLKIICLGQQFIITAPGGVSLNNNSFITTEVSDISKFVSPKGQEDLPLYDKKSYFSKAPRFISEREEDEVNIDLPPQEEKSEETPLLLTLGPQLTMMVMSIYSSLDTIIGFAEGEVDTSRFVASLLTVLVLLSGTLLWPFILKFYKKKQNKKKQVKRVVKYKKYLEKKKNDINLIKTQQQQLLFEENPRLDLVNEVILKRKNDLWKKNLDDDDFLTVCLGLGTIKSKIKAKYPEDRFSIEDEDELVKSLKSVLDNSKYIDNAPFTFSLIENNITAVVGEESNCDRLIDNMFLQIMAYHPYSDLKIVVFTSPENAEKWNYLKISPHCWDNQHNNRYFATSIEEFNEMSVDIDTVFDGRRDEAESEQLEDDGRKDNGNEEPYKKYKPYFLLFTDNIEAIKSTSLVKKILNYKRNLGFSIIIENDRLSTLPDQTHTFISVNKEKSGLFTNKLKVDDKNEFQVDFTTPINMYNASLVLANTPILLEKGKYELPKSLSFLEMFNVGRVEQLNSLERWKSNNPVNSLSVPVGIDQNGESFKMDIHEKVYGPHGLVAGTTGSGKSEWIITYILSLAVNFSPDEVQFVLIDYKGGGLAMSFENHELGIKLPHLAGTITNLDKSAINRSIASIESELKRRQSIFNDAREKLKEGQMDIYKYQQYYRKGAVDVPLSHLLIICDEFAELKQQQPEFMEQLISTSRIGRSLGVHLILATQKPSGVVNDQIWSNSRFKVCLRVQDKADSNEILKKPDAAFLKQTGAFYLEVGNDEYYNLGQSAWAGAKYYPSDIVKHTVDQSVQYINNIGKIVNYFDTSQEIKVGESQGEELLNIVTYISNISKEENFVKQQLWLPNIPEDIYLTEIKKRYGFQPNKLDFTTVIGEYDEPREQKQDILKVNIADGNIAIVGQPGSGKEMLISTLIFSSITEHTPQEINFYVLDFGAETLRKFAKFPHVGEVVFQDDMERVGGVIQLVMDELNKRKVLFQDFNGSLEYYNTHSGEVLPLICLVINAFDVFGEVLIKVADSLTSLFRDAPRYGIIFILSASAQNTFRARVLQYFNKLIVMNLQDESQYRNLSNCRKGLIPSNLYGRGICKVKDDDDSYAEFQTARITTPENELAYLKQVAEVLNNNYTSRAKKIMTIPDNITSEDLVKYITTIKDLPIGYNFYEKDIAKLDISETKLYPIITKDLKSSMPFIYALANLLTKIPNTVVRVIDIMGMFEKPILDIKLFQDDLKVIFAAIDNDVKTRTDTQPLAINIILGVGSIKGKLDNTGQEFVDSMFNGIPNCKQNIFFLIDEYKRFKLLKLQPWYNTMDTSKGIWLGPGIESQSVLVSNELSEEDKKYNYEGMAYLIKNSTYTLIKTMMDGDD